MELRLVLFRSFVFVSNHPKDTGQFAESPFPCGHERIAPGERRYFSYPGTMILPIEHDLVITEIHCLPLSLARETTKPSPVGRELFLCERVGEGGDELENIADNAVIGHFENRRVLVLINCHNGPPALHPDHVLDCADAAPRP